MMAKLDNLLMPALVLAAFAVIAAGPGAPRSPEPGQAETVATASATADLQLAATGTSGSRLVPFQGLLTDLSDNPVADGDYGLVLSLYDAASGGSLLWTETQSSVAVTGGRFSIQLGAVTSLDDPDGDPGTDDAVSFGQPRYLGIAVDPPDGDPLGPEMTPRKEIVPAVHAHESGNAETLGGFTPGELVPVGAILPFAGATPPTGWLMCNGTDVSRATYADLFNVIGDAYGHGDGSTTFSLPDLVSRFPYGSLLNGSNRGQTGGTDQHLHDVTGETQDHALTAEQLAEHAHQIHVGTCGWPNDSAGWNCGDSYARYWESRSEGSYCDACDNPPRTYKSLHDVAAGQPHKHGIDIQTVEVNHLPSYTVVNYIINY